ncbi:hypothetical protein [Mycolicibacterium elephantis]|uniref:hypothetical protein n=1 Tax=Mycolicibacterium elephantis TaxID=81858 RepID=UPI000FE19E7C|nr:hypothetical protein [Mycolicibacterium elephantis]MCV7222880.1 hypothetical protein [Mycolicibacterium elephantis]
MWRLLKRTHDVVGQDGFFRYVSGGEEGSGKRFEIWPLEGSPDVTKGCILTVVADGEDGEPGVIENLGPFPDEEAAQLEAEVQDSSGSV